MGIRKSGTARARPPVNVLVTVDERHRDELQAVAGRLTTAGMSVAEVFPLGGVIAGAVASNDLGKLQKVEGIASVEAEPRFSAH